jgi:hypothetical protein
MDELAPLRNKVKMAKKRKENHKKEEMTERKDENKKEKVIKGVNSKGEEEGNKTNKIKSAASRTRKNGVKGKCFPCGQKYNHFFFLEKSLWLSCVTECKAAEHQVRAAVHY